MERIVLMASGLDTERVGDLMRQFETETKAGLNIALVS
jgi:hypothetical protein